ILVLHLTPFRSQGTNRTRANRRGRDLNNWFALGGKRSSDGDLSTVARPVRRSSKSEGGGDIRDARCSIPHVAAFMWASCLMRRSRGGPYSLRQLKTLILFLRLRAL